MQNIDLICIGKMNAKYFAEGVAEYQKRLAAFASFRCHRGHVHRGQADLLR